MGFPGGTMIKNPPSSARNARNSCLMSGSGKSPGIGNGNPLQYSRLEKPWTEEAGKLQSMGSQESDMT